MFIQKFFRTRNIVAIILVLVLMVAAYAYAASNDVPVTSAGDDANVISGYTVTAVQYTLGVAIPSHRFGGLQHRTHFSWRERCQRGPGPTGY